ncbi:MAG: hypothetical protein ACOYLE_02945 [Bacteroidales bacterium]
MSLESLLYDSSRMVIEIAANSIEEHPEQLNAMFELCFKPYPISMRAARVVQLYCVKHPDTILPFLKILTDELLKTKVDGVKRSFLKIMIEVVDVKNIHNAGLVLNKCLDWLLSDKETIAVRAYSIDLLIKFAKEEPDLKNELILVFESIPLEEYPSLKVRCKKGLKLMRN